MNELSENNSSEKKEAMKCVKCGGEMKFARVRDEVRILKQGDLHGDGVHALYCRDCGFIEFYKEPSTKEPWRWPKAQEAPSMEQQPQQEMEQHPSETSKKRLVR